MFQTMGCAGTPGDAPAAPATGIGLSAWTSFNAGTGHNALLPATAGYAVSWRFATGGSVVMTPSVVDGVVYAGSMDGCVYALEATTGHLIWSFLANNQVMSQPLVVGGTVYFGSGNKGMATAAGYGIVRGTGYSGLYALNAATGAEKWYFGTLGEDMPTPAYQNGVLYEASGGKTFYAVSAATGSLLWATAVGSYVSMSSPTIVGDVAVFGGAAPYALIGVNLTTHRVAWTVPLPAAKGGVDDVTPAGAGDTIYVQVPAGGTLEKRIIEMAVDAASGNVLWQRTLGVDVANVAQRVLRQGELAAYDGEETGVATISGNRLYVGTPALPYLWALDSRTGAVLWKQRVPQAVRTAPLVAGDRLYATGNSLLLQFDAATGALLQSRTYNTFHESSGIMIPCATAGPEIVGGTLLLAGGDNGNTIIASPLGAGA